MASPPITYAPVDQSSFIDFTGYRVASETTTEAAYGIKDAASPGGDTSARKFSRPPNDGKP